MSHSKVIPDYAKDFKREWQYIRGINKTCGKFIERLDFGGDLFNSSIANSLKYHIKRFLKAQEVVVVLKILVIFILNILMLIT